MGGDLAACQKQCDLYTAWDGCNWFILFHDGRDEDCYLYGPANGVMEEWLDDHNIRGQPVLGTS